MLDLMLMYITWWTRFEIFAAHPFDRAWGCVMVATVIIVLKRTVLVSIRH